VFVGGQKRSLSRTITKSIDSSPQTLLKIDSVINLHTWALPVKIGVFLTFMANGRRSKHQYVFFRIASLVTFTFQEHLWNSWQSDWFPELTPPVAGWIKVHDPSKSEKRASEKKWWYFWW
jgi:hypothetical protein